MTGYKNYFEGHGVFKASVSEYSGSAVHAGWNAFAHGAAEFWLMGDNAGYNLGSGEYEDNEFQLSSETSMGQWIKLEMPYLTNVTKFILKPRTPGAEYQAPKSGELWGSKDNYTWTKLHTFTDIQYYQGHTIFNFENSGFYKYYGLVVTKVGGGSSIDYISIIDLRYFGTREQGQSVLHDGQLTLTKNLNVPRIGPALDADDTPRRDRLVVEYNTSTNPTDLDGAVRDTSGRGNDGVMVGSSYDIIDKSLTLTNSSTTSAATSYITRQSLGNKEEGNFHHSASVWFKMTTGVSSVYRNIFEIGPNPRVNGKDIALYVSNDSATPFSFASGANSLLSSGSASAGQVYHIVVVYDGVKKYMYINGVLNTSAAYTSFNGVQNMTMQIGRNNHANANEGVDGSISNFKMYVGHALTAEEVKTLYDMGRCDEGHHVVNFSKTRVGIGLGDGEAPRAALDVRGDMITKSSIGAKNVENPISPVDIRNTVVYTGQTTTDFNPETMGAINIRHGPGNDYSMWNITCHDHNDLYFLHNQHTATTNPAWAVAGYLMDSSAQGQLTFTGQHRTFIKDIPFSRASDLEGLVVSSDQNKYIKLSGGIEAGSNAITINESLPVVSLSTTTNDKKCFGVISASEDPENRSDAYGSFVTPFDKEKGDTRVYINSVGEGAIWVVNTNGSPESGDYITTSNVAGYGQKQDSDSLKNYTVAKITMDCDFEPVTQPIQQILRSNVIQTYYLGNVHHTKTVPHEFVTTTVGADDTWSNVSVKPSDVTYTEWSNLEANTQNTYTLTYTQTSNVVYDTKYTLTTTANVMESDAWDRVSIDPPGVTYAEYSNLEANTQSSYSLTFTKTTTDEKTPVVWSNLESNTQSLYNEVYYQSVEEEVASDYPGATTHTRVTDVIENELDAHGQIQWEDHATETEKAYKIRYLDVSGAQTDSANAVHIAAFVGCTYHCG